jgi:hypothetical protein
MSPIIEQIRALAKKRGWQVKNRNFCLHDMNGCLIIARCGIKKYIDTIGFDDNRSWSELDKYLLEVIRHYIPEARKIPFKFYSSDDALESNTKAMINSLKEYPPDIS